MENEKVFVELVVVLKNHLDNLDDDFNDGFCKGR